MHCYSHEQRRFADRDVQSKNNIEIEKRKIYRDITKSDSVLHVVTQNAEISIGAP
jgi:hypothetical protein